MVSWAHNVAPKGYYIAIVSTIAEGDSNHHMELQPGLDRLGKIEEKFMGPAIPIYEPIESGNSDNIYISKSYDATSHFETTTGMIVTATIVRWRLTLLQTMLETSTRGQRVTNSRSKDSGMDRISLPKSRFGHVSLLAQGVNWAGMHSVDSVKQVDHNPTSIIIHGFISMSFMSIRPLGPCAWSVGRCLRAWRSLMVEVNNRQGTYS